MLALRWAIGVWTFCHGRFLRCYALRRPTNLVCSERAVVDRRYQEDLAIKPRVDYVFFMVPNSDDGDELLDIQTNHFDPTNFMTFQPTRKYPIMFSIKSRELHGEDPISPEHHLAA